MILLKERIKMAVNFLSTKYHLKCNLINKQLKKKKINQKKPK